MRPAHERLRTGQTVIIQVEFGLEEDGELPLRERGFHGVRDRLLAQQPAAQRVVVDGQNLMVLPLDAVHREERAVAHLLYRHGAVPDFVNAPLDVADAGNGRVLLMRKAQAGDERAVPRDHEEKPVRGETAADCIPAQLAARPKGQIAQQTIALLYAEGVVIELEIFDVRAENAVILLRAFLQTPADLAVEVFAAVQPGERIILELVDHGGGFAQLDDAGDAVQDDAGPVGLGNEVRCAMRQRVDFVRLAVFLRHDDDGNLHEALIRLDGIEKGVSVHDGHHHVEEDQRGFIRVALQNLQRFPTVFRLQHLILAPENLAEQLPVERVVLDDEYLSEHGSFLLIHRAASVWDHPAAAR